MKSGFTFIELLITVGLTMFLFSGMVAGYNRFTDVSRLKQAALSFKNDLRLAQTKAIAGQKPINLPCTKLVGYEVSFTESSYSIRVLCNPSQPSAPLSTVTLSSKVKFSSFPSPVTFGVLTQGVRSNTVIPFILESGGRTYEIRLTPQGEIVDVGLQ